MTLKRDLMLDPVAIGEEWVEGVESAEEMPERLRGLFSWAW